MNDNQIHTEQLPNGMTKEAWDDLSVEAKNALMRAHREATVGPFSRGRSVKLNPEMIDHVAKMVRDSIGTEWETWSIRDILDEIGWNLTDDQYVLLELINGLGREAGISIVAPCGNCGDVLIVPVKE